MSCTSEIGISPVLLQAISQTLSTNSTDKSKVDNSRSTLKMNNLSESAKTAQVAQILRGLSSQPSLNVSNLIQQPTIITTASGEEVLITSVNNHDNADLPSVSNVKSEVGDGERTAEVCKDSEFLLNNDGSNNQQYVIQSDNGDNKETVVFSGSDMSMVNVLTALATHHLKKTGQTISQTIGQQQQQQQSTQTVSEDETVIEETLTSDGQPYIVYCNDSDINNASVPSPAHNIVVSNTENCDDNMTKMIMYENAETGASSQITSSEDRGQVVNAVQTSGVTVLPGQTTDSIRAVTANSSSDDSVPFTPCPICGDKVSGYHYGIFSCESCKGFFKRTVQNKKTFSCSRGGDCGINTFNRKKCPGCRFARCLSFGMRVEAIRTDRSRGGRSSYEGCSPHGRVRPAEKKIIKPRKAVLTDPPTVTKSDTPKSRTTVLGGMTLTIQKDTSNGSQLVAILNHAVPSSSKQTEKKPVIPQVLTDIMNLEPLLVEDEPPDITKDKFTADDPNLYDSLLMITELRLYKIVRWARNLPQFSAIGTDDQILLLQNSWSDLIVFCTCWKSTQMPATELRLAYGKTMNMEHAQKMQLEDPVNRMLNLTDQLRRLQIDQYEFVGLKVLTLLSPDVKGLKDPNLVKDYQEKISDALYLYTSSHYPSHPNKFGEMLIRLSEVAKISYIAREMAFARLPNDLSSCGLLIELLKGDNAVKDL